MEALTWRWIFFINIPIGIATILCLIPYKENTEFKKTYIDYKGFFIFGISIALLLLSTNVRNPYWYLIIGLLGLLVFVLVERKETQPFLPVSLLRIKGFSEPIFLCYFTVYPFSVLPTLFRCICKKAII